MVGLVLEMRKLKPVVGREIKIENSLNKMLSPEPMSLKLLWGSDGEGEDKRSLLLPLQICSQESSQPTASGREAG